MRAFEVRLNGKKLCLAGIGDDGVLTASVGWVTGPGRKELFMETGGLISPVSEHVRWISHKPLRLGDTIQIKIIEAGSIDRPIKRIRRNPAEELRAQKRYVREMAKQFGWRIQGRPKPSS